MKFILIGDVYVFKTITIKKKNTFKTFNSHYLQKKPKQFKYLNNSGFSIFSCPNIESQK